MNLDDQLRAALNEEAVMRTAPPPDVQDLILGGQARRRRRRAVRAGGGVLAAVIAVGGWYGVAQLGSDDDSVHQITHRPTPQPLPDIGGAVAIDPGTYEVGTDQDHVVAPYSISVPAGWEGQSGGSLSKHQAQQVAVGIEPFALDKIRLADDTCRGGQTFGAPQTSTAGLVAGLRAQGSGLQVSDPVADTVGGLPATRIDVDYPTARPLQNCRLSEVTGVEPGALQVWTGYFVLHYRQSASVYVVEVGGRTQVFVTQASRDASAADRAELQSIVDSISFPTAAQ